MLIPFINSMSLHFRWCSSQRNQNVIYIPAILILWNNFSEKWVSNLPNGIDRSAMILCHGVHFPVFQGTLRIESESKGIIHGRLEPSVPELFQGLLVSPASLWSQWSLIQQGRAIEIIAWPLWVIGRLRSAIELLNGRAPSISRLWQSHIHDLYTTLQPQDDQQYDGRRDGRGEGEAEWGVASMCCVHM